MDDKSADKQKGVLLSWIVSVIAALIFGILGYQLLHYFLNLHIVDLSPKQLFFVIPTVIVIFAGIGFLLGGIFLKVIYFFTSWAETALAGVPVSDILVGLVGLIIGLIIAALLSFSFSDLPGVGSYLPVLLSVVFGYMGLSIALRKKEEIQRFFSGISRLREMITDKFKKAKQEECVDSPESSIKILDTSVIIDGRLVDIVRTGFLEGLLVVPRFVLVELQRIADSTDPIKRSRGRRGLEILRKLREMPNSCVIIDDTSLKSLGVDNVDEGLVKLAEKLSASILTTDYNLNNIAQIEGIKVLNVNELSNALKPVVVPGEELEIEVLREGKEPRQGVGYMEDGTMVVVEDGVSYIGKRITIVVTSILQTPAGRIVFGKPKRR